MSLPKYLAYKDSGVAWLGDVPVHWDVKPFYSVATERNDSNSGMRENNLLSLSYGRIIRKDMTSNDGLLPESFETYQIVIQATWYSGLLICRTISGVLEQLLLKKQGLLPLLM